MVFNAISLLATTTKLLGAPAGHRYDNLTTRKNNYKGLKHTKTIKNS